MEEPELLPTRERIQKAVRMAAVLLFAVYFSFLLYRLFFYAYGQYFRFHDVVSYNLIPFKTIGNYIFSASTTDIDVWFFNLFGNILAFMPLGFLLPIIFTKMRSYKKIALVTLLVSSAIEIAQYLVRLGVADIDDVILNTAGGVLGFTVFVICFWIVSPEI